MERNKVYEGHCLNELKKLDDNSVDCCVTSPPYYNLRSYSDDINEVGREETLPEYISKLVEIFEEVRRVLKPTGICFINIGDSYSGSGKGRNSDGTSHKSAFTSKSSEKVLFGNIKGGQKPTGIKRKELMNVPHRLVLALSDAGWYHRQTIIWAKATSGEIREGSSMPESCTDRWNQSFEYIFMLTKNDRYYFDQFAVKESVNPDSVLHAKRNFNTKKLADINGNFKNQRLDFAETSLVNMRSVWRINLQPGSSGQHIAGYPEKIPYYCIKAGSSQKGCCKECGVPYTRILEKMGEINHSLTTEPREYHKIETSKGKHGVTSAFLTDTSSQYKSNGWQKQCKCATDDIVPSLIIDPFLGSGTTSLVALKEGRDFIGFELNPEYIKIAKERMKHYHFNSKDLF